MPSPIEILKKLLSPSEGQKLIKRNMGYGSIQDENATPMNDVFASPTLSMNTAQIDAITEKRRLSLEFQKEMQTVKTKHQTEMRILENYFSGNTREINEDVKEAWTLVKSQLTNPDSLSKEQIHRHICWGQQSSLCTPEIIGLRLESLEHAIARSAYTPMK